LEELQQALTAGLVPGDQQRSFRTITKVTSGSTAEPPGYLSNSQRQQPL
jgi:hypothetical protein